MKTGIFGLFLLASLTLGSASVWAAPSAQPNIFYTVSYGDAAQVKALLDARPALLNERDRNGGTLLHDAAGQGKAEIIQILLDRNAKVNARDDKGQTPLHHAVQYASPEIVKLLLANKADVDAQDSDGKTPLFVALEARHSNPQELVKVLVEAGADVNLQDKRGRSALREALVDPYVNYGKPDLARLLLTPRAQIDLFAAAALGLDDKLPVLINPQSVRERDDLGQTPLHLAALFGQAKAVERLLAAGADVNAQDKGGDTPLATALELGRVDVSTPLLAHGADVNQVNRSGETPLFLACRRADTLAVARRLIERGADFNAASNWGDVPLFELVYQNPTPEAQSLAALLMAKGAEINYADWSGETPLHRAVQNGSPEWVEFLLAHGANIEARDKAGQTPLFGAALRIAQVLLAHGANIEARDNEGQTPLMRAAGGIGSDIVDLLLAHHVDIKARDMLGQTALHKAAQGSRGKWISPRLLAQGAELNAADNNGVTPLGAAALADESETVDFLISKGAKLDLSGAIFEGKTDLAMSMLQLNPLLARAQSNGRTPLHIAAQYGDTQIAKLLLACGADVDGPTSDPPVYAWRRSMHPNVRFGTTPLILAASGGHAGVVDLLLAHGADTTVRGMSGPYMQTATAEEFAAAHGYRNVLDVFQRRGKHDPSLKPGAVVAGN